MSHDKRLNERVALTFKLKHPRCMACEHWYGRAIQVHEIASGPARRRARGELCCLLALCAQCHREFHENRNLARELALKLARDPDNYDRSRVMEIKGVADTFITQEEVLAELEQWQS